MGLYLRDFDGMDRGIRPVSRRIPRGSRVWKGPRVRLPGRGVNLTRTPRLPGRPVDAPGSRGRWRRRRNGSGRIRPRAPGRSRSGRPRAPRRSSSGRARRPGRVRVVRLPHPRGLAAMPLGAAPASRPRRTAAGPAPTRVGALSAASPTRQHHVDAGLPERVPERRAGPCRRCPRTSATRTFRPADDRRVGRRGARRASRPAVGRGLLLRACGPPSSRPGST